MSRTKLTLTALAAVAAISAQAAVAQARADGPGRQSFITDTLAPGGGSTIHRWFVLEHRQSFITDTLAPGGSITVPPGRFSLEHRWFLLEHSSPAAQQPQGYRFITDTLAPGGGPSEISAPSSSGFDWGDAGIGAGAVAGLSLILLAIGRALQHRRRVATV